LSTLFTIGYQMRSLDEFVALLREHHVAVLIDVRDTPWSHKPGFSKRPLEARLRAAGIEYVHAGFAGNPKSIRATAGPPWRILEQYARHLDRNPQILEQLTALIGDFERHDRRACLACYERDPGECHRGVLAGRWAAAGGGQVTHIDPFGAPRLAAS
jgi:uncharacterized protein (DUF488 family)